MLRRTIDREIYNLQLQFKQLNQENDNCGYERVIKNITRRMWSSHQHLRSVFNMLICQHMKN